MSQLALLPLQKEKSLKEATGVLKNMHGSQFPSRTRFRTARTKQQKAVDALQAAHKQARKDVAKVGLAARDASRCWIEGTLPWDTGFAHWGGWGESGSWRAQDGHRDESMQPLSAKPAVVR